MSMLHDTMHRSQSRVIGIIRSDLITRRIKYSCSFYFKHSAYHCRCTDAIGNRTCTCHYRTWNIFCRLFHFMIESVHLMSLCWVVEKRGEIGGEGERAKAITSLFESNMTTTLIDDWNRHWMVWCMNAIIELRLPHSLSLSAFLVCAGWFFFACC